MNRLSFLIWFYLVIVSALPAVEYPITVSDDSGHMVTLPAWPVKILSFTVFTDEILFDLLPPERFAAATSLATDKQVSNVADKAVKVLRRVDFNVEGVLAFKPDLVLVADWSDKDKVAQIRSMGLPIFLIKTPTDISDVKKQIRKLAYLTGVQDAGERLITEMETKVRMLTDLVEGRRLLRQTKSPIRVMDYNPWGAASGRGTSWDVMIRLAGLENAVSALKADAWGQVPVSKEILILTDPEVLILPSWTYDDQINAQEFKKQVLQDPSLRNLKALKNGDVYVFPEKYKSTVSHYMVDGAAALAEMIW